MRRLGELERRVMDVLWDSGTTPLTGREVADQLPDRAYTTVLTILERLRRKSLVERTTDGRTHRFAAADTREATGPNSCSTPSVKPQRTGVRCLSALPSRCRPMRRRFSGEHGRICGEPLRRKASEPLRCSPDFSPLFAVVLLGPFSKWLCRATWVSRAPRAAVLCWQCIGLGAIVGGHRSRPVRRRGALSAGLCCRRPSARGSLFSGHPLQGLGLYDALALTLAADLCIVLVVVFGSLMVRTVRSRAQHRRLLDLVAHQSAAYPGTDLISDSRMVAYCVPGVHPRIVLSEGTLLLLGPTRLQRSLSTSEAMCTSATGW